MLFITKLQSPQIPREIVPRQRLLDGIEPSIQRKLTLISAPAGFGKTTLITCWLHSQAYKFGWLSLDEMDSELSRFLRYFIAALQQVESQIGQSAQSILKASATFDAQQICAILINEMAQVPFDFYLVLDDYHLITNPQIHNFMNTLLDNQPNQLHLIIISRLDPPFPLSRMRVRRELLEIRYKDLRFSLDEVTIFFNDLMNLGLPMEDIQALEQRTEGWIASLQLAALSLRDRENKSEFVKLFTGSHHYIIDYLVEEVISSQPAYIQNFLCRTSLFHRLCPAMCDFILEGIDDHVNSYQIIREIRERNLFLISINEKWSCYRYHHLFSQFLRQRLNLEEPHLIPKLYFRASLWYEGRYSRIDEAVYFALAAKDFSRSVVLLEKSMMWILKAGGYRRLLNLFRQLPTEVLDKHLQLSIGYCWALLLMDNCRDAAKLLKIIDDKAPLNPQIFALKAFYSHLKQKWDNVTLYARKALENFPAAPSEGKMTQEQVFARDFAVTLQGWTCLHTGDLTGANTYFDEGLKLSEGSDNYMMILKNILLGAQTKQFLGNLHQAFQYLNLGFRLLFTHAYQPNTFFHITQIEEIFKILIDPAEISRLFRLLSDIHYLWNCMDAFQIDVRQMVELSQFFQGFGGDYFGFRSLIRLNLYNDNWDEALMLLNKLDVMAARPENEKNLIAIDEVRMEMVLLAYQKCPQKISLLDEVGKWIRQQKLKIDDNFDFIHQPHYFIFAKYLIFHHAPEKGVVLLERLIEIAKRQGYSYALINYQIFLAIGYQRINKLGLAMKSIEKAVALGEAGGYIRNFIDAGREVFDLLLGYQEQNSSSEYIKTVLAAFPENMHSHYKVASVTSNQELSRREMSILYYMGQRYSNQEIADKLYLSVNTIKWYSSSIYQKLGVKNRHNAVKKAKKMGLL